MKLSLNFVKDYVDLDDNLTVEEIAEAMTKAGSEYDSAKKLVNATKLIIGEIKECEPHPDSDHLHVCTVNVGKEEVQIVCGAPNVRKGIKVIVALPGAVLPGNFEIKAGKIRGVESNGMICALFELGLEEKTEETYAKGIEELNEDNAQLKEKIEILEDENK